MMSTTREAQRENPTDPNDQGCSVDLVCGGRPGGWRLLQASGARGTAGGQWVSNSV